MARGQWYPAAQLIEDASQEAISQDALKRAKEPLGIIKPHYLRKDKDGWHWMLPLQEGG